LDLTEVRSVGAIIRIAFGLYRRYPLLFLILAAGVVVPLRRQLPAPEQANRAMSAQHGLCAPVTIPAWT
jgi:hypothetical protein